MKTITSVENDKIKDLVRLKKTSERRAEGLIIVDGQREVEMALKAGWEARELFFCPGLIKESVDFFGISEEKRTEVSEAIFKKICYKDSPDGYFLLAKEKPKNLDQVKLSQNPLLVILESVEKPGNLGAIIRTAYAVGADAVIVNDSQTDIYNPNVIRASEGFVFEETVVVASREETGFWLKKKKIKSLAAATSGKIRYSSADLKGPLAIVLGSEADGLREEWLKTADKLVKIPMKKGIDSLNVSVSAAIIAYEALRQREGK